eukprot:963899_1
MSIGEVPPALNVSVPESIQLLDSLIPGTEEEKEDSKSKRYSFSFGGNIFTVSTTKAETQLAFSVPLRAGRRNRSLFEEPQKRARRSRITHRQAIDHLNHIHQTGKRTYLNNILKLGMGYERARRIHDEWLMAMSFASSAQVTTDSSADSTQITASSSSASSRVDMGDTVSLPSSAFGASLGSVPKPVSLPPCVFSSKMMSVDAKMSTGDISSHPVLMNGLTSSTEPALPPDYAPAQSRSSDSPFQYKTCPQCKKAVPNATRTCKFCLNVFYRKVSRKRKDSLTPPGVKRKPGRPRKNQILSVLPSNSDIPPPPPPTLFDFPVDSIPIDAIQPPTPQESVLSLHPTNPPATVTDDTDVTMADMDSATDGTNAGMDSATDGTNAGMDSSNVVFVHMDLSDVVVPADVDPPSDDPEMYSDYDAIDRAQMASSTPSDLEEEVSRLPFPLPPPPPLSPPPPSPLPPPPPARKRKREGTMRAQKICKNCGKYCANA